MVYSDKQRLELEKEFQYNRYITMRRKTELSVALGLSERQVRCLQSKLKLEVESSGLENNRKGYDRREHMRIKGT